MHCLYADHVQDVLIVDKRNMFPVNTFLGVFILFDL